MKTYFTMSWPVAVCAALLATASARAQVAADTAKPAATIMQSTIDPEELDDPLNFRPARPRLLVGPRMGINRNYHSGGFRVLQGAECPKFQAGTGWGYLGGITAEFAVGTTWSIVPAVTYESRPGYFREELPQAAVLLEGSGGIPVNQSISTSSTITYRIVEIEAMYKQDLVSLGKSFRLSVTAGPVGSVIMGGTISQFQDLNEPENARFLPVQREDGSMIPLSHNGRRFTFSDNADIPGRNAVRFSLKAGLQAELGLFHNKLIMYPGIFYDYGLSHVTSLENWNLNTLLFQIDFRRAF
jgi:hypothetical protein